MPDDGDKQSKKVEDKRGPLTGKALPEDDPNLDQKNRWRELERTREVLSKKPEDLGFIKSSAGKSMEVQRVEFQKEEKKKEERNFKFLTHRIEELNRRLAELHEKIAEWKKEIGKLEKELEKVDENLSEREKKLHEIFGPDWEVKIKEKENANHPEVILYNQDIKTRTGIQGKIKEFQDKVDGAEAEVQDIDAELKENGHTDAALADAHQSLKDAGGRVTAQTQLSNVSDDLKEIGAEVYSNEMDTKVSTSLFGSFSKSLRGAESGIKPKEGQIELTASFNEKTLETVHEAEPQSQAEKLESSKNLDFS